MAGYLLDTNVLSELLKKKPEPAVVRALNVIAADNLFTSSICVMELRRGSRRHPDAEQMCTDARLAEQPHRFPNRSRRR